MNKEVIYIEPEDDITDIISKIEKSKEKIIALVPPKKAGVFRSVVNIKLIAKASSAAEKTVVIVTTDPSITKLAGATKVPVTKDLKTAPTIPVVDEEEVEVVKEDVEEPAEDEDEDAEEDDKEPTEDEDEKTEEKAEEEEKEEEAGDEANEKKDEKEDKLDKKAKKAAKKLKAAGDKVAKKIKLRKKLIIFGIIGLALLILALVWAFAIAPSAKVTVEIKTTLGNFSENISFTSVITEENTDEGKFYLEETKNEKVAEKKFEATGKKNVGKKATGTVVAGVYFKGQSVAKLNAGTDFTIGDYTFYSDEDTVFEWDGNDLTICANNGESSLVLSGCLIEEEIAVTASAPGAEYNIAASTSGWSTGSIIDEVKSFVAMTGGTDETITIVQQSDVDKALEEIATTSTDAEKEALLDKVKDDALVINSSFKTTTSDPVVTPAVGEQVKDGEKAVVKVTTTSTVFSIDEIKVKEYITKKAKISDSQKIYQIKNPFIDNFSKTENGYTGKLKTSYSYGPKITESSVVEIVKGKGLGEANHALKDIDGVKDVKIDPSFPWVTFVPNDENKITVNLEINDLAEEKE